MKSCAAIAGVIVGFFVVGLAGFFLFRKAAPAAKPGSPERTELQSSSGVAKPNDKVEAPRDSAQRMRDDIDGKRVPFFRFLHQKFAAEIERATVLQDIETLDLYVPNGDEQAVKYVVENAIMPSAAEYAFKGVRFYIRNPPSAVEPFKVVAEASVDRSGRWNTFFK